MSLAKAIEHGKEHRKPYYRSGRFDYTCRPHGSCPYCFNNRYHRHHKALAATQAELEYALDVFDALDDFDNFEDYII